MEGQEQERAITWSSVKLELNSARKPDGQIDYDKVRRRKLAAIEAYTGRPVITYATDFLNSRNFQIPEAASGLQVTPADMEGLAEVVKGLDGDALDLILHSPGGSPEAAESIVSVIRQKFTSVRVLIPVMAKSAATMIALSANEILLPQSAELGPIDPQFLLSDGRGGQRMTPAQTIIDEVARAQHAVQNQQSDAMLWLSQVQTLPPGLYQECLNAVALSKNLVGKWLESYMFAGESDAAGIAKGIVDYLADHNRFLSHGRRVDINTLALK